MQINEPDVSINLKRTDWYQLQLLLDEKFQIEEIQNSGTGEITEYQDWLRGTESEIQTQSEDQKRKDVTLKPVDWEQIIYVLQSTFQLTNFNQQGKDKQYVIWLRHTIDNIRFQLDRANV